MTLAREVSFHLTAENFAAPCVVAYAQILVSIDLPEECGSFKPDITIRPRISLYLHYSKESALKASEKVGGICFPILVSKGLKAFTDGEICLMPKDAADYHDDGDFTNVADITIVGASLPADENGKFNSESVEWIESIRDFTELRIFS